MVSIAMYDFHISYRDFWRLTPALYLAVHDRHILALEEADARFAQLVCITANIHRGKNDKVFKLEDFLPKRRPKKPGQLEKTRQSVEEQIAMAKAITLKFGGTVASRLLTAEDKLLITHTRQ